LTLDAPLFAMKPLKSQNYYEMLGVPRYATVEDIRNAYEVARHTYRENSLATYSLFSDEENTEILDLISGAYEVLFNPETRKEYDDYLVRMERQGIDPATQPFEPTQARHPQEHHPQAEDILPPPARELPPQREVPRAKEPPRARAPQTPRSRPEPRGAAPSPEAPLSVQLEAMSDAPRPRQTPREYVDLSRPINGETLRSAREHMGISIGDLAESTKIRRTYLEYLEEESFEFLPAAVYVKGFVTIVARVLSLPPDKAAEDYMEIYQRRRKA